MEQTQGASVAPFDQLIVDLRALRAAAGDPSYGELARRVMHQRVQRGMSEWEARVGRTTVYDAFQPGRRMLDPDLVGELVRALGGCDEETQQWIARCKAARRAGGTGSNGDQPVATGALLPGAPEARTAESRPLVTRRFQITLILACLTLNMGGRLLVNATHMPLYLDMVGTAIAAIILGPWSGAAVGIATSFVGVSTNGWTSIPFFPVEVVGALMWGYGVRKFRCGTTVPRYLLLNVAVAVACSVTAVPVIVLLDHGITGSGADQLTRSMNLFWHNLLLAVASQNLLTSLADKLISGFFAIGVAEALPADLASARERMNLRSVWLTFAAAFRRRSEPGPRAPIPSQ